MYIQLLGRQMAVCSFDGVMRLTKMDKDYWNVVSIHGPREQQASLPHAKAIHYACFDDLEEEASPRGRSPRQEDIATIFDFIRNLDPGPPPAPLVIHCRQGRSRSTGVALSWIYGQLPPTNDRPSWAIDLLLQLRPQAIPNRLVLGYGLAEYMAPTEARRLADWIASEPRLLRNRFEIPVGE